MTYASASAASTPRTATPRRGTLRRAGALVLATLMFAFTPGLVPQAEASPSSWFFGTGFNIGGVRFNIGLYEPGFRSYGDYYFRTSKGFHYDGYSCSRACYRDGGHFYHHRTCPVVRHHLDHYQHDYHTVTERYFPPGYYGHGPVYRDSYRHYDYRSRDYYRDDYRGRGYYRDRDHYRDRDYKYDRGRYYDRDRHDRGRRYDDHHRGRGHRHDDSCRH